MGKLGVPLARVRLIHGQAVLRSDDKLSDAGVCAGSIVNVIILPPLYQGSEIYEHVAQAYSDSQIVRPTEDEVHDALQDVMEKKSRLNDAFASLQVCKLNPVALAWGRVRDS